MRLREGKSRPLGLTWTNKMREFSNRVPLGTVCRDHSERNTQIRCRVIKISTDLQLEFSLVPLWA